MLQLLFTIFVAYHVAAISGIYPSNINNNLSLDKYQIHNLRCYYNFQIYFRWPFFPVHYLSQFKSNKKFSDCLTLNWKNQLEPQP